MDENDELRTFIRHLILNMRMNYGHAMALAGMDPELIYNVHHAANDGMMDWLKKS